MSQNDHSILISWNIEDKWQRDIWKEIADNPTEEDKIVHQKLWHVHVSDGSQGHQVLEGIKDKKKLFCLITQNDYKAFQCILLIACVEKRC